MLVRTWIPSCCKTAAVVAAGFLLMVSFVFSSTATAKVHTVTGEFVYTYGDNESLSEAKETCKKAALKNALESAMIHVRSDIRIGADGLSAADIQTVTAGTLKNVELLEERINGRTISYKIQATVDAAALERALEKAIQTNVVITGKPTRIAFWRARIRNSDPCGNDDTINKAPDAYIVVKDRHGNELFRSANELMKEKKYWQIIRKNRNSYQPDFTGISMRYAFSEGDYLLIFLMDNDDAEGVFGKDRSAPDQIGRPFRLAPGQPKGRRVLRTDAWELDVDIYTVD